MTPAQVNIDEWLDEDSPSFNRTLKDAIFHYKAREDKGDRLHICIATEQMYEATWKYALPTVACPFTLTNKEKSINVLFK